MTFTISDFATYLSKYIRSGAILRLMLVLAFIGALLPEGFWYGIIRAFPLVVGLVYAIVLDDSLDVGLDNDTDN